MGLTTGPLSREEMQEILNKVGDLAGWDFSSVHDALDPLPWDYMALVPRFLSQTDRVLDIGTGGGERLLQFAPHVADGLGVDASPEMIAQARRNKAGSGVENVDFRVTDAYALDVADEAFDVVLNRHCTIVVDEILRVLRPGGLFITQQVACRNTQNLFAAFGWTPESFGPDWWQPIDDVADEFRRAGCHVVAKGEYDVRYWFLDVPSLLFWLKSVPLPEPFDLDKHWEGVNRILLTHTTPRGIETNEHRELLIVRKPTGEAFAGLPEERT